MYPDLTKFLSVTLVEVRGWEERSDELRGRAYLIQLMLPMPPLFLML